MKKRTTGLILGFLLVAAHVFAADGDLIVNGNTGIGTASPQGKLHVSGGAAIFDNPSGSIRVLKTSGTPAADDLGLWYRGSNIFAIGDWDTGTKGVFINTTNGSVGIGRTDPTQKLEVWGGNVLGTIMPSQSYAMGLERNLLFNANNRFTVTQSGPATLDLNWLFDGRYLPSYSTAPPVQVNPQIISIEG